MKGNRTKFDILKSMNILGIFFIVFTKYIYRTNKFNLMLNFAQAKLKKYIVRNVCFTALSQSGQSILYILRLK